MRATGDLSFQVALPDPVRTMMAFTDEDRARAAWLLSESVDDVEAAAFLVEASDTWTDGGEEIPLSLTQARRLIDTFLPYLGDAIRKA